MNNNRIISLNLNIRGIGKSPTLAINELSKQIENEGKTIYRLGLGQSPFPVPARVVETLKNNAHQKDYLNVNGLEELRKAVAKFHREKDHVNIKPENVLIGPGSKELMFLLQLVYYGDIILPTPCWVSYAPQARIIGRNIKLINTTYNNRWKITAAQLEEFLLRENDKHKPRLLILNYPANPDGCTFNSTELEAIAGVAKKFGVIVLSDEIYGQLHYKGKHISIARFYPEGTIISSGLSKWCGAGGWRLGTFAFPAQFKWLLDPMAAVASETYTSVSAPIQYAAVSAFTGGISIERYLWQTRRILAFLAKESTKILSDAGINVYEPDGAFYLFADFSPFTDKLKSRGIENSKKLCEKLLEETGVAILPGEAFLRQANELTARLAFVNFNGADALAASETVPIDQPVDKSLLLPIVEPVLKAMKKIADWVS
ncbi:MAG: aminotransferase class I/II-fold pyridoxal phosphate-dependent enzyme [Prolixibacteraceae bacterium]|nr:aminotransferase class I/II-fold pyridoxal phosphate-dependent enzyme [Prolixibacteraceae bacterium]MBN2774476.1 aminotransferase class I/II-fold pyridoxal phosphate-dependent enzyme [Prolixibacteraceae bacterium]